MSVDWKGKRMTGRLGCSSWEGGLEDKKRNKRKRKEKRIKERSNKEREKKKKKKSPHLDLAANLAYKTLPPQLS